MKVVQLNADCGVGSIGKICVAVSRLLNQEGIENYILYALGSSDHPNAIKYTNGKAVRIEALIAKVFGIYGFSSAAMTYRLIHELKRIKPDVVHMHNMHNHNAHIGILMRYFRKHKIRVFWTFHDCWAFTGYCTYFDMHKCEKWKSECRNCPQYRQYSCFFDRSRYIYRKKKKAMDGVDLTIITPSHWMGNLVRESFLGQYPVHVIHNGIDRNVFRPTPNSVREKYGCEGKHIVLGVAYSWDKRKGGDVLRELAGRLGDDYKIIMVGTNDQVDEMLPEQIISIHRTHNQTELAELYSAADVFVIPTREDNYPTVNMEALACGTPVVTFRTGGSPEMLDETCGIVVECEDTEALERAVRDVCENRALTSSACLKRAEQFSDMECFRAYADLYKA